MAGEGFAMSPLRTSRLIEQCVAAAQGEGVSTGVDFVPPP